MRVLVRIRPLQDNETPSQCLVPVGDDCIRLTPPLSNDSICVSRVYPESAPQVAVFEESFFPVVGHVINGGLGTVIAYGPTGTGKRYSIEGTPEHPGLLPFSLLSIFTYKSEHAPDIVVSVSWYEIHGESVQDLFVASSSSSSDGGDELRVVDKGKGKGLAVDGLTALQISSPEEAFELINNVQLDYDRQSHTVFSIHVSSKSTRKEGCLSFVVMVGAEQALGSLSNFRLIVESLYNRRPQIPYHKSKLTLVLKESLSSAGACTTLICTVSPSRESTFETSATLALASQAVHVNPKADKVLEMPQWSYRPRSSQTRRSRTESSYTTNNNNNTTTFTSKQQRPLADNQGYDDSDQEHNQDRNDQYNGRNMNSDSTNYYNTNGSPEDSDQMDNTTDKRENGNSSSNHHQPNNNLPSPSPSQDHPASSRFSSNGSDHGGDNTKLTLLKNNNKNVKRGPNHNIANFLTPQSPLSTPTTTPSPPSFRFALTTSPPTPHKERVPSAHDPAVEVQKLRIQLQKALQEINGFKIYKDVIDKNIVALRDSLSTATDAKAICEKELKAKDLLVKKKNKEIESLNKSLKEALTAADRATKAKVSVKRSLAELESVDAERLRLIDDAIQDANVQRQERVQLEQEVKRQLETLEAENARILEQCSRLQHDTEDKDKELSVLTEEIIRLTQLVEEGSYIRGEVVSLDSKTKELQQLVAERDQQIAQLTEAQAVTEKMVMRDSRTANIMAEATIAQLRKQISDLQIDLQTLRTSTNKHDSVRNSTSFATLPVHSLSHPSSTPLPSATPSSSGLNPSQTTPLLSHSTLSYPSSTPSTISLPRRSPTWSPNFMSASSPSAQPLSPAPSALDHHPHPYPYPYPHPHPHSHPHPHPHSHSHPRSTLHSQPSPQFSPYPSLAVPSYDPPSYTYPMSHEPSFPPIPSTPTSISNPLLDSSKLSTLRAPPPLRNNPPSPPPPAPISPTTLQTIAIPFLPPPPPITPTSIAPLLPLSPASPSSSSISSPFLSHEDSQAFSHKNWAQILRTMLPDHPEDSHMHTHTHTHTHTHQSPPFNMAQVQMTIDNVRKLVSKTSPSQPLPPHPPHTPKDDFVPSTT